MRVLISGAGIAGPALALRLAGDGAAVTVVEIAPGLRTSGFAVDFRGPTHHAVLRRLGVLDDLRAIQTHGSAMICVDEHDREIFTLPATFTGGELEVRRRDLSRLLHDRGAGRVDYRFGDTITKIEETADFVRVEFRDAGAEEFDLVIGADGMHSTVRRLVFGAESRFLTPLGYHIAGWELAFDGLDSSRWFNVPGRMASVSPGAVAMLIFRSTGETVGWHDQAAQKRLISSTFDGLPWHVPRLLDSLDGVTDLYFDAIARIDMPSWTRGRIALVGDAAWGVTLGGMGVGTGLVGAHVLAGELASTGDHRAAFAAYETRMRAYAGRWQKGANPGRFLAPATRYGLTLRNRLLSTRPAQRMLLSGTKSLATDTELPAYS
ncbi:FAD-dependent monooxygenase [Actinoplanes couchii]|uniref:FAD-dependent oxidoreductase n=1 Tax=Actinoplanes couchii TaxID=403638 RepID=A0ABQ3XGP9_9ACTN|nr:FAD-dependent monooxygenase [Actinoplanes couchii]MDR6320828.1 2-polyprenyl-6-methoxyphenol hydroxylase-like FAD-dependent oxidoreductase [Actinoplanes couchii]GID57687.1 FAD-dependent oxidoreductase [Actinoplanes couchii]